MKLRTVTGNRYPVRCACALACGEVIPPSPDVKVVIDLDTTRPRLSYLPGHSPDSSTWPPREPRSEPSPREPCPSGGGPGPGSLGPDAGTWKGNGGNGSPAQPAPPSGGNGHATGFTPASALPATPPAPPAPPKVPAPPPLALLGSAGVAEPSPSAQAGTAWATSQLTFSAAAYESCKAGYADYACPGETPEALRARVHAVVLQDVEWQARALRDLHARLSDASGGLGRVLPKDGVCLPSFGGNRGAVSASPATLSAPRPGAPSGAPAAASPPLKALVHDIRLELSDASPTRLMRKEKVWVSWLQKRGYSSLQDVRVGDEWGLGKVLYEFEAINRRE